MAVWLPAQNKFYLPPQPTTRVLNTDEYVKRMDIFYHASSDRLLTVGHPFFDITKQSDGQTVVTVPKVSPNQYRVFRLLLPDPNTFAFGDRSLYNPDKERLVWAVRGIEIGRGQPLGNGVTGNSTFDRLRDVENNNKFLADYDQENDTRANLALDPKQTQLCMVGCKPALGEHWGRAKRCLGAGYEDDDCPPIELVNTEIEDGDMIDIGFGAMDFKALQHNRSMVPLDVVDTQSKYPDYIKMASEPYGDRCFFFVRREQSYARHILTRSGDPKNEKEPARTEATKKDNKYPTVNYCSTPSGSLISSEAQLFNRPYWIQRAQGQNNGIAWGNQLFVTVADNTRGTPLTINIGPDNKPKAGEYKASDYKTYIRHVEEYDIAIIIQLCKVTLTPENLALIHTMDPDIIESWHLNVTPPSGLLDDTYRYINSLATKCPPPITPKEKQDPYSHLKFWEVDLKERLTEQLDQTPLGRKFLYQTNALRTSVKRSKLVADGKRPVKRRRGNK